MQLTKFQECLLALTSIRNSIEKTVLCVYLHKDSNLVDRPDRIKDPYLQFIVTNYLLILLSSFMEEWTILNSFVKKDTNILLTMKIVAPAIDRFKKWPGIHKIRSSLLAHSPRSKDKSSIIFPWEVFKFNKCPTTFEEILLLAFCALMAIDNTTSRHSTEYMAAQNIILSLNREIPDQGIPYTIILEKLFKKINGEIIDNKEKYK